MNTPLETQTTQKPSTTGDGGKWFFVTALIFLVLACLMLAGRPGFLLTPQLTGHGLSWLLLLLFGAGLPAVFGAVYWAIPRAFATPLYSGKFVFLHYGFHFVGFLLVLLSVVRPAWGRGDMGMTFIACGALAMGINLVNTFRRPARPDVASGFLAASVLWLLIVALLGVPFATEPPVAALRGTNWSAAWLLLALTGVLLNLPMGLALRVTPCALRIPLDKTGTAWYALALSNAALAWMFPAAAFGTLGFLLLCTSLYAVGVLLYFARFFSILQKRPDHALPWDSKILLTSFSLVPVAAAGLLWGTWERITAATAAAAAAAEALAAGLPAVVEEIPEGPLPVTYLPMDGALVLLAVLGIAIPAVVALGFSLLHLERKDGSVAQDDLRPRLAEQILLAAYFNYACGVLLVIPGAWLAIEKMLSLGSLFLLMGALGFLGNAFFAAGRKPLPAPGLKEDREIPRLLMTATCHNTRGLHPGIQIVDQQR